MLVLAHGFIQSSGFVLLFQLAWNIVVNLSCYHWKTGHFVRFLNGFGQNNLVLSCFRIVSDFRIPFHNCPVINDLKSGHARLLDPHWTFNFLLLQLVPGEEKTEDRWREFKNPYSKGHKDGEKPPPKQWNLVIGLVFNIRRNKLPATMSAVLFKFRDQKFMSSGKNFETKKCMSSVNKPHSVHFVRRCKWKRKKIFCSSSQEVNWKICLNYQSCFITIT